MSTAQHLATIGRLCSGELPAEHGGADGVSDADSGSVSDGVSVSDGPGYRVAELLRGEFWDDDGTGRAEAVEQFEAECAALVPRLTERWGEPQELGLQGLLIRDAEGESIPEPWRALSWAVISVHLWRISDRWLALGVSHRDGAALLRLLAVATRTDPPA